MKSTKLQEQQYLEKRILNPIDRSQGRCNDILEYVKKNSKIKRWVSERTGKEILILSLDLPTKNDIKNYHTRLKENTPEELEKTQEYLAKKIFENN